MITRIAWFSSATHLAVLSCLHQRSHQYPWKRNVRFFFMVSLAGLLMGATIPTVWGGDSVLEKRASCMFHQPWDTSRDADYEPIFGAVFLILNITVRLFKSYRLLSRLSLFCKRKVAACVLLIFKFLLARPFKNDNRRRTYLIMVLQPLMAIIIVLDVYWHLASSMLVEVGRFVPIYNL